MVNTWKVPYQFRYLHKESIQHKNSAFKSQQNQGRKALQSSNKKGKFPYSFLYGNAIWGFKNLQQINVSELPTNKKCRTAESIIKKQKNCSPTKTYCKKHSLSGYYKLKKACLVALLSRQSTQEVSSKDEIPPKKCQHHHQELKCTREGLYML